LETNMHALKSLVLLLSLVAVAAAEGPKSPAPSTQPVNKYCMVQGPPHECDQTVTYVHEGKTYGFCCPDCIEIFKKDPAKYLAKAK